MKLDHKYNLMSAAIFFLLFTVLDDIWRGLLWGGGALLFAYGLDAIPYAWKVFLRWKYDLDETQLP